MGYFAVSSWGRMVFEILRIPSGIFWRCEMDEILKCHFTLGSPYDFAYLVFFTSSQPSAQVFAKHGFVSVLKYASIIEDESLKAKIKLCPTGAFFFKNKGIGYFFRLMNLDGLILGNNPKIHIRNPQHVHKVLTKFTHDGPACLQVISDFDRTLTKHSSNGKLCPSSHAVLEDSGLFSDKYTSETKALRNKYYPLEMDINIGPEEKEKLMVEWWTEAHRLLLEEGLKKNDIQKAVKMSSVEFREWSDHFLAVLRLKDVPVLIFSAGIGTVVREVFLQKSLFRLENIEIISNFLFFNSEGKHVGFEGPMIHTFNKGKMSHLNKNYFVRTADRVNVVLLGDTLGGGFEGFNYDYSKDCLIIW